ncbi:MAG: hypothetical protein ACI89X_000771 [Planctomycetota bacterium]|jgi:hypothetical protein
MCSRRFAAVSLKLALLCVALAPAASAQKPDPDPSRVIGKAIEQQLLLEVGSRLKSTDLATIAWGGYLAAQHRVATVVPMLQKALHNLPQGEHRKETAQALMDALVVHGATVEADDLRDFQKGRNEGAALALAAKDPAAHRAFLMRMHQATARGRFSRWLASGNLLARAKDRDFARSSLGHLAYKLTVSVCEEGHGVGFGMGGRFGGKYSDGKFVTPMGFPPSVTYRVVTRPKAGDVLFAAGKRNVYYRREVHHERKVGPGSGEMIELRGRQQLRVDWLGKMSGTSFGSMPPESSTQIWWETAEHCLAEVEKFRAKIVWRHDRIVDHAIKAGWFDEDERAGLAAKVSVQLADHRGTKTPALPKIK